MRVRRVGSCPPAGTVRPAAVPPPRSPAPRHRAHRPCARICVLLRTRPHREGPRTVKTRNRKSKRPRRQRRRCRCRRSAVARCNCDYLRVKFKPGKISATNHADTKAMLRLNICTTNLCSWYSCAARGTGFVDASLGTTRRMLSGAAAAVIMAGLGLPLIVRQHA